jgi:hypothetical protein
MNAAKEYSDYLEHLAEKYNLDDNKIDEYRFLAPFTKLTRI